MEAFWHHIGAETMPKNLSIKNVPDELAAALKAKAAANHRSLNGELIVALTAYAANDRKLTTAEIAARSKAIGGRSPSSSVDIVREMRDER
jgi:antitoxin FitA